MDTGAFEENLRKRGIVLKVWYCQYSFAKS